VIAWGRDPGPEPQQSRRDLAETAGWDPGDDHGGQPAYTAAEWDALPASYPSKLRIARWVHQGSRDGCDDCGRRCDYCGDRTCTKWGPAPDPTCSAHFVCEDCATDNHCRDCAAERAAS
jgi:hypothetical protein